MEVLQKFDFCSDSFNDSIPKASAFVISYQSNDSNNDPNLLFRYDDQMIEIRFISSNDHQVHTLIKSSDLSFLLAEKPSIDMVPSKLKHKECPRHILALGKPDGSALIAVLEFTQKHVFGKTINLYMSHTNDPISAIHVITQESWDDRFFRSDPRMLFGSFKGFARIYRIKSQSRNNLQTVPVTPMGDFVLYRNGNGLAKLVKYLWPSGRMVSTSIITKIFLTSGEGKYEWSVKATITLLRLCSKTTVTGV
ncbi:hypothetical protein CLU79DRAFT_719937 [Phycomyces nitens]|nr:hypothetical protein CLU79DRAFT_719937 [Phycomyces nitens]